MPIHLPPITQQLIKGLEQGRAEQLATLSKLVNLIVGEKTLASVEKVEMVNPQQRSELQKLTQEALQLLNRAHATPAVKAQIAQLNEQLQILSSPQLKWAHLLINNRPLLTYTDKPLAQGQPLPVQLINSLRLVQQDMPAAQPRDATSRQSPPPTALLPTPSPGPHGATEKDPLTGFVETVRKPMTINVQDQPANKALDVRQQTQALLAGALRQLLPQKDKPLELFNSLPLIQQLPATVRREFLSSSLQQALKTVADQLRSPQQLSNPKLLAALLKNNGVFFENKLMKNLQLRSTNVEKNLPIESSNSTRLTNQLTSQDLKGALLQLLNRIRQESASSPRIPEAPRSSVASAAHPATTPLPSMTSTAASGTLIQTLPALLKLLQLPNQRSGFQANSKSIGEQLLALLHQHTLGALAKIQLQQVHAINHQQSQAEVSQPSQSWLLEIPVKHGQDVNMLELRLDQEWIDNDQDAQNKTAEKIRQWSVTLGFDLPAAGKFYAQLSLINKEVSAKFWAEEDSTLGEAKNKLALLREQLEAQGLVVKHLQCLQGSPPTTAISLNYSLVDVTT